MTTETGITLIEGLHDVRIDHATRTVRPEDREGDVFFGLRWGTNGTATETRRALVAPPGYLWRCSDGQAAVGTTLVPTNRSDEYIFDPWGG